MLEVHISKHSLFRLKITVGCQLCTCPSIHFALDEDSQDHGRLSGACVWCVYGVLWWCVVVVCVVVLWWCVCVVCGEAWHTLSLLLSLLPLLFPFLFLSCLSFSLFFFFFSCSFSFSSSCSCSFLSSPSTHSSLLFPSRQQTLYKALINKHGVQL